MQIRRVSKSNSNKNVIKSGSGIIINNTYNFNINGGNKPDKNGRGSLYVLGLVMSILALIGLIYFFPAFVSNYGAIEPIIEFIKLAFSLLTFIFKTILKITFLYRNFS